MANKMIRTVGTLKGRISRSTFCLGALLAAASFLVLFVFLETMVSRAATWILYPPFFWAMLALSVKRLHDRGHSAWRLLILLIPLLGPVWIFFGLVFRKGSPGENQYGPDPREFGADYLMVDISNPGGVK